MNIVRGYPPNIDELDRAFGVKKQPGLIFAWGSVIFKPEGPLELPRELIAHEGIHCARQGNLQPTIEKWWHDYIADPEFRLAEELPAHVAEYREYCSRHADPNKRAMVLFNIIAKRLCSPIYGGLLTHAEARKLIKERAR